MGRPDVLLYVFILSSCGVAYQWGRCGDRSCPTVHISIDHQISAVTVSEFFLSVAIDASLLTKDEKYITLLGSEKLQALAKGLSPGYLRFGGTKGDFLVFDPKKESSVTEDKQWQIHHGQDRCKKQLIPPDVEEYLQSCWVVDEPLMLKEYYEPMTITRRTLDALYDFANCSGFHLIFGLNALLRKTDLTWNSSNAEELLNYCASKQYSMSWELGNEPNSFRHKAGIYIDGYQLGEDFLILRKLLQNFKIYKDSQLFGPDIGQPRRGKEYLLESFLEKGGKALDAVTWHHYYEDGRKAVLEEFLSSEVLDTLIQKARFVLKVVNETVPGKKVWLGETSSTFGGGTPHLSDTYAAGFMWLDKLGLSARLGIDVVVRQVIFGAGTYHLVDSKFRPLPDYWLSYLYKKLVGTTVLTVNISGMEKEKAKKTLRVYAHCTNRNNPDYPKGAITMFAMNLSNKTEDIKVLEPLFNKTIDQYLLLPAGKEKLLSQTVQLNGQVIKMVDDRTFPALKGKPLPPGTVLELPAFSYAFYVIKDAKAASCS
ncbi:heparanase [Protopterus annectens]|uniref:heparanase n=1 Tax=Protopterus annectens TaxID=7888 RepID=UPI001CFBD62C|nr:heparanase [Protopterus annectens]